ncbi:MAG TPA: hypothetical protein VEY67_12000 [Candidatus Dormibacteraeota bacterium]|nr:hypothetical protein [Candidatus Dormibacteraeota bacterium]
MRQRPGRVPLIVAALAPASLVLSHDLSFLASYGSSFRSVLVATGHDGRWTEMVGMVIGLSALLAFVATVRLGVLWRRVRSLEAGRRRSLALAPSELARCVARVWPWLLAVTLALFLGQENLERLAQDGSVPGLTPLFGASTIPPIAVIMVVSAVVSAVGALFARSHEILVARIRAALAAARPPRRALQLRVPVSVVCPSVSLIAAHLGRRAPPLAQAA